MSGTRNRPAHGHGQSRVGSLPLSLSVCLIKQQVNRNRRSIITFITNLIPIWIFGATCLRQVVWMQLSRCSQQIEATSALSCRHNDDIIMMMTTVHSVEKSFEMENLFSQSSFSHDSACSVICLWKLQFHFGSFRHQIITLHLKLNSININCRNRY